MNDNLSFLLKEWTNRWNVQWNPSNLFLYDEFLCNYPINVCNWFTHLQPEWQTTSYWQSYFYSACTSTAATIFSIPSPPT